MIIAIKSTSFRRCHGEESIGSTLPEWAHEQGFAIQLIQPGPPRQTARNERFNRTAIGLEPHERNVGLVFQHFALFPHMTNQDNIAYGLKYRNIQAAKRDERVA